MDDKSVQNIAKTVAELRVAGGVAIIGAGASFEIGLPLASQLAPLVWHTLDSNLACRAEVSRQLGLPDLAAKRLVGDDWNRLLTAFACIDAIESAWRQFQQTFARLDHDRLARYSPGYEALATLIHAAHIEYVLSLNWDSQLETAYFTTYGVPLNAAQLRLAKPHGDCAAPDAKWVLPNSPGFLPDHVQQRMSRFVGDRPRLLLVVGYSENDDFIVRTLIGPLEDKWRIVRIGPRAKTDDDIRLPANDALTQIAAQLLPTPEVPGWFYESFANQRDLTAAISGERLGPRDVVACPRLPQVALAKKQLESLHYCSIHAPPGCGKSITVYQVANDFRLSGREVLVLAHPLTNEEQAIRSARHASHKRLLVIDDAQTLPQSFLDRCLALANDDVYVIRAVTERVPDTPNAVRISRSDALEALAAAYRSRRDEVLPIIRLFDASVSDQYHDTPLEGRIDEAAKTDTPWQFNFVMRGGWTGAWKELPVLRDADRADILLFGIAAKQIASLDEALPDDDVFQLADHFGRPRKWATNALEVLRRRKVVLPAPTLRCPHIWFADYIVDIWCRNQDDPEFERALRLFTALVTSPHTPLQGIAWLLNALMHSPGFRFAARRVFDDGAWSAVKDRCLATTGSRPRRMAAIALSSLLGWKDGAAQCLASHAQQLSQWLEQTDDECAYAFAHLVNLLWNYHQDGRTTPSASAIVNATDPVCIADRFSNLSPEYAHPWQYFVSQMRYVADDTWRAAFAQAVDREMLRAAIERLTDSQLYDISHLIYAVATFDEPCAWDLYERALPVIKRGLQAQPLEGWEDLRELIWRCLGFVPDFLRHTSPTKQQRAAARDLAGCLPIQSIARAVAISRQRDWERYAEFLAWIHEANRRLYRKIVSAIDLSILLATTERHWKSPPRELRLLFSALSGLPGGEPARSWIIANQDRIQTIDPITASIVPEAAVAVVGRGGVVDLSAHNRVDWDLQLRSIVRIASVSEQTAISVLCSDAARIAMAVAELGKTQSFTDPELAKYLDMIAEIAPAALTEIFALVPPNEAAQNWPALANAKTMRSKRLIARVLAHARKSGGKISDVAGDINRLLPKKLRVDVEQSYTAVP